MGVVVDIIILRLLIVIPVWRICSRIGFSGAISLIAIIPLGELIVCAILAYSKWPEKAKYIKEQ